MTKKKLAALAVLIILFIIGWFVYRALNSTPAEVVIDSDPIAPVSANTIAPPSLKVTASKENTSPKTRTVEVEDENFDAFDKLENNWLEKVNDLIGPEKFSLYLEMKERNDKEKMQAYKEYHDYLRQKYGDKFSYNISEDQSIREKKINQRYLKDLLNLVGPDLFKQYIKALDQFNEEIRRNNKEAITIEF